MTALPVPVPTPITVAPVGVVNEGPAVVDIWLDLVEVGVTCKEGLVTSAPPDPAGVFVVVVARSNLVVVGVAETDGGMVEEFMLMTESPVKTP